MGHGYILKGECTSTQKLIWGILEQSGLSIKFSTLMIREAKGPMLNADQIGPQCHPWRLQPVAWPFITCLEGLLMGEGFVMDWNVKWSMCVFTLTDACMCECTYMCGDNDVRDNNELADELSQACGHRGQKHAECVCACVCVSML